MSSLPTFVTAVQGLTEIARRWRPDALSSLPMRIVFGGHDLENIALTKPEGLCLTGEEIRAICVDVEDDIVDWLVRSWTPPSPSPSPSPPKQPMCREETVPAWALRDASQASCELHRRRSTDLGYTMNSRGEYSTMAPCCTCWCSASEAEGHEIITQLLYDQPLPDLARRVQQFQYWLDSSPSPKFLMALDIDPLEILRRRLRPSLEASWTGPLPDGWIVTLAFPAVTEADIRRWRAEDDAFRAERAAADVETYFCPGYSVVNLDGTTTVHPDWEVKGNALRSSNILKRWETAILKRPSCYEATF